MMYRMGASHRENLSGSVRVGPKRNVSYLLSYVIDVAGHNLGPWSFMASSIFCSFLWLPFARSAESW